MTRNEWDRVREALDTEWLVASPTLAAAERAAVHLAIAWTEDDGWAAPVDAEAIVLGRRRTLAQKVILLRVMALERVVRAAPLATADWIAQGLEEEVSWTAMAKAAGRSRQSFHRQYRPLVDVVEGTNIDGLADVTSWMELPRKRTPGRSQSNADGAS